MWPLPVSLLLTSVSVLRFFATAQAAAHDREQVVLNGLHRQAISPGPHFSRRQQSPELCDAGSQHWTGTVNVSSEKSMFFWYYESRDSPETDPVLLWMSGGPGATSELGQFKGIGPCAVNEDGNSTRRLEFSWIDHANVVFIDQPVGVGFSQISDRNLIATNLHDGARDVYTFLSTFTKDVFPQLANRTWHITGESMGGHYVTSYTEYILKQERERALQGLDIGIHIDSAIIVDGYIDGAYQYTGYYDFFCEDWRADGRPYPLMNATACQEIGEAVAACEKKGAMCRDSYDVDVCAWAMQSCDQTVGKHFADGVKPGGWNPYDSRFKCQEPPLCSNFSTDETLIFLNQLWVQEQLGFPNYTFELIDFDTNRRWAAAGDLNLPVTRELTWLLDNSDVRVLFFNGNNDIIINTPGQIRLLDAQPWKGQAHFRSLKYQDWFYTNGKLDQGRKEKKGGTCKGDERLRLYTVDEAGHFSAMNQPEALGAVVADWLRK
ncbi:unnamed protein product [Clonostachys byssicola]|uniref:Uncharacterized protein n=1 Tax=Clonostachys byssicola TaxID=160290 RepID=A0A9N9UKD6_9HYPO|nr:unnamed protein product [Clonostachys byssicola]